MFTGIITDIGTISAIEERGDLRVTVQTGYDTPASPSAHPLPTAACA
jgi:riboflavin synthase alpha subunit